MTTSEPERPLAGIKRKYEAALQEYTAKSKAFASVRGKMLTRHRKELEKLERTKRPRRLQGERLFRMLQGLIRGNLFILHTRAPLLRLLLAVGALRPQEDVPAEDTPTRDLLAGGTKSGAAADAAGALRNFLLPAARGGVDLSEEELLRLVAELCGRRYRVEQRSLKWPFVGYGTDVDIEEVDAAEVTIMARVWKGADPLPTGDEKDEVVQLWLGGGEFEVDRSALFDEREGELIREGIELEDSSVEFDYKRDGDGHGFGYGECVLLQAAGRRDV